MTIRETIRKGMIILKNNNITEPNIKARLVMQYVLNKPREYLMVYDKQTVMLRQEVNYFKAIKKLCQGIPIQHITHRQEFMKMTFYVDENVLIPRQDTEVLVEEAIRIAKKINAKKFLDLCTGSGAIAVSLAKYIEGSSVTAVDISSKALNVARLNAKSNGVEDRITFVESDLFKNLKKEKYDIIVSNPPYVKRDIMEKLDREVQKEPKIALDGGYDGLDFYRKIISNADEYLKFHGYLCFEIGYDQKEEVEGLIKKQGNYVDTYCKKDLCDNDRVIVTKLN